MKRREFITLLEGAAAAWPVVAVAQQAAMPVIGYLSLQSAGPAARFLNAFGRGLAETGYVEGENVTIVYRWVEGQNDRLPAMVAELVRRQVSVIAAFGLAVAFATKAATTSIPIIFLAPEDPVRLGLVTSLARPGGNLTGINFLSGELVAKRLELLRELVPGALRVAVLVNPANTANADTTLREVAPAARAIGLQIHVLKASTSHEIEAAFQTLGRDRPDALFVGTDPFFSVGIAAPAHGAGETVLLQGGAIVIGGILRPTVGMMHATPWWIAGADGGLECSNSEPCIDRAADGVTYDATGPSIEDRSQVHKACCDCDIGDVGYPQLVRAMHARA